jgi:predicted phage terminase large subunit-like protein
MYELIMQLIKTIIKYRNLGKITIVVENVAYQAAFMNEYKRISAETGGTTERIEPITPVGDKESRWRGISGIFESLKVIFNESVTLNTLIDELTQFGFTTYDDCADALTHAIQYLYKHRKKLSIGGYS